MEQCASGKVAIVTGARSGIGKVAGVPLEELSVDAWRYVVDVNLTGVLCTQRGVCG